jgi:hypothetical protein
MRGQEILVNNWTCCANVIVAGNLLSYRLAASLREKSETGRLLASPPAFIRSIGATSHPAMAA